ncbi:hypothetical protein Saga11_12300 [Bacillus safensis]|nr:hypothetical protein Saga11_12300 [Bacillus safensis]
MKKYYYLLIAIIIGIGFFSLKQDIKAETINDSWVEKAHLPEERVFSSSAVVDGKIYIFGGGDVAGRPQAQTYAYNPDKDSWEVKSDMPTPRLGASVAVIDKKVYIIAGRSTSGTVKKVEVYDTEKDTWEETTDFPKKENWENTTSANVINNKIYVVSYSENKKQNFYEYDPDTKKWEEKNHFPKAMHGVTSGVIGEKIYIAGGYYYSNYYKEVYEYDIKTSAWSEITKLQYAVRNPASIVFQDKLLLIGGETSNSTITNKMQVVDPKKQTVSSVSQLLPSKLIGANTVVVNNILYVIGGTNNPNRTNRASKDFKPTYAISLKSLKELNEDSSSTDIEQGNKDDDVANEDGDALLIITMVNGLQKEYDLSMKEVNAFLSWYKKRDAGEGPGFYEIDEHDNNKGPFESKKDYVVFNNILMFEVNKYKK